MILDELIVTKTTTIIDAMKKIDANGRNIIYICEGYQLLGVLTDGDIRRHILNNDSTKGIVESIMNLNVKYLSEEKCNSAELFMNEHKITSVPIVGKEKQIIYIQFAKQEKVYKDDYDLDVPVVIMAGGKGTRLEPFTKILPKPLIPIGDKTITELIMDHFKYFGCKEFLIIVNYKKELIKSYFSNLNDTVEFVDENTFLGTAGGLKLIENKISNTFFMTNCDILVEENYREIYTHHKSHKNIITIVSAKRNEVIPYGVLEVDDQGSVVKLKEKPSFEYLTNTGLYVIEKEFLKEIPQNTFVHITEVIQTCIDKGLNVGCFSINESEWMDMGQKEELEKMIYRFTNVY